jgi:hypothetical protein
MKALRISVDTFGRPADGQGHLGGRHIVGRLTDGDPVVPTEGEAELLGFGAKALESFFACVQTGGTLFYVGDSLMRQLDE